VTVARLPESEWFDVVSRAPLVSIDLIVEDAEGQVLLGLRRNRPAQGSWFVPGGVIRKGETLDAAFSRIARDELGLLLHRRDATLLGVYEHFYDDNFLGTPGIGTHYVVQAYRIRIATLPEQAADTQHGALRAASPAELLADCTVHANTQAYFSS